MPLSVKRNKIMKNITLYVDNGTYLTRLHPYTILCIYPVQYSDSAQYEAAKKGSAAYHLFLYDTADHFYHSWSVQLP